MLTSDFSYRLPDELIAQQPLSERSASRLLCLEGKGGALQDRFFGQLPVLLAPEDLLVFNDTRVIPARLHGRKASGGKVEMLVERVIDDHQVLAQLRASKSPGAGTRLLFEAEVEVEVVGRQGSFFVLRFLDNRPAVELLSRYGHLPLPPYIARADTCDDAERYQTVYARKPGAVAAPTAGLHFNESLFAQLDDMGVERAFLTLHVGAGTFQPLRVEDPADHVMHKEYVDVPGSVCEAIGRCRARGGRVVAVGTTTLRSLESAAATGELCAFAGETDLFVTPGYRFHVVDALITNFHLPESTLLMLVSAFGGFDNIMNAYRHAVAERYRFYSYGDAMFITRAQ